MALDRQRLIKAARRVLDSGADAEDAVQDSFVRAFDTYCDWRDPHPAWLHKVLRNIALDRRRRLRLEHRYADVIAGGELSVESLGERRSECEAGIRHLLNRVSPEEAAVILLREVFGFDYDEIGDLLGRSEPACRQFLHRARRRSRQEALRSDAEELHVALCCRAVEGRDPIALMDLIRVTVARASSGGNRLGAGHSAGASSRLVQVNGRYALALVLDGVVLCMVPVGVEVSAA